MRAWTSRCFYAITAPVVALSLSACGSDGPTSPSGDGQHRLIATVMLETTGPNPREISVEVGDTVSFMNHDSVPHTVAGGAAPGQAGCPELNAVGVMAPFEIHPSSPFLTAKTCDYHIPRGQTVLFTGRIVVR